jgi:hypothetical protein
MTQEQRIRLLKFSEECGLEMVHPIEQAGILGLQIGKDYVFSPEKAHSVLLSLSILTLPGRQVAA